MHTHHGTPPAAAGPPALVLPFPAERARAPALLTSEDEWRRLRHAFLIADQFRDFDPDTAAAKIVEQMAAFGAGTVSDFLDRNAAAISTLRALVASLVEADRRIAHAADRALCLAGMPSWVRP